MVPGILFVYSLLSLNIEYIYKSIYNEVKEVLVSPLPFCRAANTIVRLIAFPRYRFGRAELFYFFIGIYLFLIPQLRIISL